MSLLIPGMFLGRSRVYQLMLRVLNLYGDDPFVSRRGHAREHVNAFVGGSVREQNFTRGRIKISNSVLLIFFQSAELCLIVPFSPSRCLRCPLRFSLESARCVYHFVSAPTIGVLCTLLVEPFRCVAPNRSSCLL